MGRPSGVMDVIGLPDIADFVPQGPDQYRHTYTAFPLPPIVARVPQSSLRVSLAVSCYHFAFCCPPVLFTSSTPQMGNH